ncbi:hypothetical protein [Microbacterium capsulatum]|uniref:Uncharacterized protein n=1 Tax=Microbacterium capsulatum TaxID=3041921 RepID=A0ABU0XHJ7_9MICO|nr:hypothetical protein [Microbacterium sp. ASV81]MDQ4214053.1 hypothetical protein [Microbacterium sp. ASV81]
MLNAPTIVIPFCEQHAAQVAAEYADLMEHLPILTDEARAYFRDEGDSPDSLCVHWTPNRDANERRDDNAPEGAQKDADER